MAFSFVTSRAREFLSAARRNSAQAALFGPGCCAAPPCGAWLGAEPELSDLLIVFGAVTSKGAKMLRAAYERMPEPRRVIAAGTCAASGGWPESYSALRGVSEVIPVDRYVPGCPPDEAELLEAVRSVLSSDADGGEIP